MRLAPIVVALFIAGSASVALAQDFGGDGAFAFDPEISVVNSGALLDAQVVVSSDRKYVTINMRPSLSRLQALNVFPVQQVGFPGGGGAGGGGQGGAQFGFVGGAGFIDDEIGAAEGTPMPEKSAASAERAARAKKPGPIPASPVQTSPSQILKIDPTAANSVLRKEGMHRID